MTNLPNAPLVYTIGVVRFPKIPEIQRFATGFHDLIRARYPRPENLMVHMVSAIIGPEGLTVETPAITVYQYVSPDRRWAFILTNEVLALHTDAYLNHIDFADRFVFGLEALLNVPDIRIEWIEAVGMRYVSLIEPREGETLRQYLYPWVLPDVAPAVESGGLSIQEGMYVATYKTSVGDLRFQALRNPPTTLPPELDTPAIHRNGWKRDKPDREFALLDIDHGCRFEPLEAMDTRLVRDKVIRLRTLAKDVFWATGTDHAKSVWKEKIGERPI